MQVVKINEVAAEEAKEKIFKGQVTRQSLVGKKWGEFRIAVINFSPGAVNVSHTHTFDQVLYVTEGKGMVGNDQQEVTVTPGTLIFIPAGEKHWHGATKDSKFSHLAINPPGDTSF